MIPLLLSALLSATPPPVERATIWPDRAEVVRSLPLPCTGKIESVTFSTLPPGLDRATVRARVDGEGGRLEGLSVRERVLSGPSDAAVAELDRRIESLEDERRTHDAAEARALEARARAEALREQALPFLSREAAAAKRPELAAWRAALDRSRDELARADATLRAARIARRALDEKLTELRRQRDERAAGGQAMAIDVEVAARCTGGKGSIAILYLVPGVGWTPVYEARADESAGQVKLVVGAQVHQATGEDWKGVRLVLSTSRPRADARPPEPLPIDVERDRTPPSRTLVLQEKEVERLEGGRADSSEADEAAPAAEDQGLSVQLTVAAPAELPGDGRPMRVAIEALELPAKFTLVCVPRLLPAVLREGAFENRARYPLPPGPVDLFARGGWLGRTGLPVTAQGAKLELAFGAEEAITVRREELPVADEGKTLGGTVLTRHVKIELHNQGNKPASLEVREPVPVSELDEITVTLDQKKTTRGFVRDPKDGTVTWKRTLAAGEKQALEVRYEIDVPRGWNAAGL